MKTKVYGFIAAILMSFSLISNAAKATPDLPENWSFCSAYALVFGSIYTPQSIYSSLYCVASDLTANQPLSQKDCETLRKVYGQTIQDTELVSKYEIIARNYGLKLDLKGNLLKFCPKNAAPQ